MEIAKEVVVHAGEDCLKILPFLFIAFLLIELLTHYSVKITAGTLAKVGKAGPVLGALAGCVPQCGFSVLAANLYAGRIISMGTLLAVFIATSDEAILIILGEPGRLKEVAVLVTIKVLIAVAAGYMTDLAVRRKTGVSETYDKIARSCDCQGGAAGILRSAGMHTIKIFVYLFVLTVLLDFCMDVFGLQKLSGFLMGNSLFQPVIAALIGLIPNCAAALLLTQLYLSGAISFASLVSGLCAGAGVGLLVLFKMNVNRMENLKITGLLFGAAVLAGLLIEIAA